MAHQDHSISHAMPPPVIPMDPALSLYPSYYSYQPAPQHLPPHLSLPPNYSSPSSQGSDTIGTPPTSSDHMSYPSNINGKRPAALVADGNNDSWKKSRKEDDSESQSPLTEKDEGKAKPTRGSRACTVCRRLKMKCVGAEQGPPCKRCMSGNHECIFEESNRGKRSSKKHELLTRSLKKMERTLDTVLRSINNPGITSGMVSRSPSPTAQTATTQALLAASPSPAPSEPPYQEHHHQGPGSPKLHSLPDNTLNPLGLLAEASLANRRAQASHPDAITARTAGSSETRKLGVASDNYFKPGPMTILPLRRLIIERQVQPEMLSFVGTEDVVALFNIYFDHINMHIALLDRNFHTPSLVCSRSPFLLTTICSISSKFYTAKPDLHLRLTELAKKLAFSVPGQGYKSVEIVQAYLLLALYGCGAVERFEQDKTWLLLGMAIRMATDLNLHRKTAITTQDTQEGRAREKEVRNREGTWLLCFCLDRSYSAQMGKPYSIKEDCIIRNATPWYRAPTAIPTDALLAGYVDMQRILARSLDLLYSGTSSPSGLQTDCDYMLIIKTFETQIVAWREQWLIFGAFWNVAEPSPSAEYKKHIAQFYFHYAMLVLNSFGLQNAIERSPTNIGHFFARCHSSATAVAMLVRDQLGPSGYMRYSPDSHFVQTSYAVLSLLKFLRPEFQAFLDDEQKTLSLTKDVADTLDNIAANPLHTPALYSGFLRAIISAKIDPPGAAVNGETKAVSQANNNISSNDNNNNSNSNTNEHFFGPPGEMNLPSSYGLPMNNASDQSYHNEFQFESEMGPVADMSTFPPTMAANPSEDMMGSLTMDNILSSGFWDSVLVPGYNNMDGLSGGFVFGAGGSGLITPRMGATPLHSGANSPARGAMQSQLTQMSINAAFNRSPDGKTDS